MRHNTKRLYSRIQTQFRNMTETVSANDAKLLLAESWFKSPQSISRIVKMTIPNTPLSKNPNQTALFSFDEKKEDTAVTASSNQNLGKLS
jgi:hypothetical protein